MGDFGWISEDQVAVRCKNLIIIHLFVSSSQAKWALFKKTGIIDFTATDLRTSVQGPFRSGVFKIISHPSSNRSQ